ncbi:lipid II:glycine glycyltransferase FemX [Ornithinibacillus californiensis]|uniref:lipid II:glycine glycyltransferase FemX n=1 Tax=Ornithinibacillus californiensis TaxID=161536 RepID=UPI00064D9994|nr:peptidoglycan bridge formation glycyltransferase FemA/FemB family protein [Ornithinibacillus californiensis]
MKIVENHDDWNHILDQFNSIDVYYSYEYGQLFANEEKGLLRAVYYKKDNTKVFYPFIQRKLQWGEEELHDIVTPYGYGGPHIEGENRSLIEEFFNRFGTFCKMNNIITETIRFHPLAKNYLDLGSYIETRYIRHTTAVDLHNSIQDIQEVYTSMNKRNIKKAKKEGISCWVANPTSENINTFINLYKETMDRNQASNYYYFNKEYFFRQMETTNISNSYLLFSSYDEEIIAGVMIIVGKEFAHYHLGASKTEYLHLRPNNILFDYMIQFCKEKGSSLLHLGGGYEENDGLFQFKTSFTNNLLFDYYIGTRIFNQEKYNKIASEVRDKYDVNENYFPIYRGIVGPKVEEVRK